MNPRKAASIQSMLRTVAVAAIAVVAHAEPTYATQRALLIGVGDYIGVENDLDGPPHDVAAMRDVLTSRLGFAPGDIVALVDQAATRQGILDALDTLVGEAREGDFVFIYLSGHGTSAFDAAGAALSLSADTGAFVPADYPFAGSPEDRRAALLIGTRDVRPRLEAIDRRGVSGMVVVDSCFSANSARSFYATEILTYRVVNSGLEYLGEFPMVPGASKAPYPYRRIVTIAASGKSEKAVDWGERYTDRTHDGKPHGAFTDSLLRVLKSLGDADADHDETVTNRELFNALAARMRQPDVPHSPKFQPSRAEDPGLGDSPAFRHAELLTAPQPPARPLGVHLAGAFPLVRATVADTATLMTADEQDHDIRVERAPRAVRLLTRHGDQIMLASSEQEAADALRQQPWIRRLIGTANSAQRFEVSMPIAQGETYAEGDVLHLAVSADRPCHLLVVAVAADGTFRVLHPTRSFFAVGADTEVRFQARVDTPLGIDHVVAVAFLQPPTFYDERLLEDDALQPGSALHGELRTAFTANDPNQARAVSRVVTVPRTAVGRQGG